MRVGVLADIHGNAPALRVVLDALRRDGIEHLLVAGDLLGYYPFVSETLELLRTWSADIVLGNHDGYVLGRLPCSPERAKAYGLSVQQERLRIEDRSWLGRLPFERQVEGWGRRIHLRHGGPGGVEDYVYPDRQDWTGFDRIDGDIVILGHTHYPFERHHGGKVILNPGSCGQPRDYDPRAAYGILEPQTGRFELCRREYDVAETQMAVREAGLPEMLATILDRRRACR